MGAFEALTNSSHRLCRWYLTDDKGRVEYLRARAINTLILDAVRVFDEN